MAEHQWHFQKYSGPSSRLTCPNCHKPRCFTLYVDDYGNYLDKAVGRCDHVSSCGYHMTPREYYKENPEARTDWKPTKAKEPVKPRGMMVIPKHYLEQSFSSDSTLIQWLINESGIDLQKLADAVAIYMVGATRAGWTIWWQMDELGRIRTGKAMRYRADGHRDKPIDEADERMRGKGFSWMHNLIEHLPGAEINRERDYTEMQQCLFGQHLLRLTNKPVAIVESEKTALIMSCYNEDYIWMACGGIENVTMMKVKPLIDHKRKVVLFPDRDGAEKWEKKRRELAQSFGNKNIVINHFARDKATERDPDNADIADIVLRRIKDKNESDLQKAISAKLNEAEKRLGLKEPHLALRLLQKKFDLIIYE